jgi:hypothetical protein
MAKKISDDKIVQKIRTRNAANKAKLEAIDTQILAEENELRDFISNYQKKIQEIDILKQGKIDLVQKISIDDETLEEKN